jgi:hypothetical protein
MAWIRNIGRVAAHVGIILEDGKKAFVTAMARNKGVTLPPGSKLDPHWMALNGKDIRLFDAEEHVSPGWTVVGPSGVVSSSTPQQTNNGEA